MTTNQMQHRRVRVTLSDPWDLGESLSWQPLSGELVRVGVEGKGGRALVKFDQRLIYHGESYQFAVAAPRHEGSSIGELDKGRPVFCSFIGVSDEHGQSQNALSTEHWRGGLSFVGDIEVA